MWGKEWKESQTISILQHFWAILSVVAINWSIFRKDQEINVNVMLLIMSDSSKRCSVEVILSLGQSNGYQI